MVRILLLFSLVGFLVNSFGQSADVTEGCAPLEVKFTSSGSSATFYWDFNDGNVSIKKNPINVFNKPGKYKVTFREGQTGPVLKTIDVTVYQSPDLEVKVVKGCVPFNATISSVSKIDPGIKVQKYTWVFGEGTGDESVSSTINHIYPSLGKYSVSLGIVTGFPSCNKTAITDDAIEVILGPSANFTTTPDASYFCTNQANVSFTNSSIGNNNTLEYNWDLGNGTKATTEVPKPQVYKKGQFNIRLAVNYKDLPQCVAGYSKTISVGKIKPRIISPTLDSMACANGSTYMVRTDFNGKADWTVSSGIVIQQDLGDTLFIRFSKGGAQQIKLTGTDLSSGCQGDSIYNFTVDDLGLSPNTTMKLNQDKEFSCSAPFDVNFSLLPISKPASLYWFVDGQADSTTLTKTTRKERFDFQKKTSEYDVNEAENHGVYVIAKSTSTGCLFASNYTSVTLQKPTANFKVDNSNGCAPVIVSFQDLSSSTDTIVKWTWVFGDGTSSTKTKNDPVTHVYGTPGEYKALQIVTTKAGCVDSSFIIPVKVGSEIATQLDFEADKLEVCQDEQVKLSVTKDSPLIKGYHFESTDTKFFHCPDEKSVLVTFDNSAGLQDVSLTVDYNGCLSTIVKPNYINVKGPLAKLDYYFICSDPYNYQFLSKSLNASTVDWSFGDGSSSNDVQFKKLYAGSGDYTVTLTANNSSGCKASTESVLVKPRKVKAVIDMDTTMCKDQQYMFSAAGSSDVYGADHSGYSWFLLDLDSVPYKTQDAAVYYALTKRGRQRVLLEVEDVNGCKDSTTTYYTVYGADVDLRTDKSIVCNPTEVSFTDSTKSDAKLISWKWNIYDTTILARNADYTFKLAPRDTNIYISSLEIKDSIGCIYTGSINVDHYKPTSIISLIDPSLCLGDTAQFEATDFTTTGSNLTFKWDFGNGQKSTNRTQKVYYPKDSVYTAKLIYQEVSTKCMDSTTYNIEVHEYPTAYISTNIDTVKVICAGAPIQLNDSTYSRKKHPLLYNWDFDNGQTGTNKNYTYAYPRGKYTVRLIASTYNGCADTAYTKELQIRKPEADFSFSKLSICKGDSVRFEISKNPIDVTNFTWNFGDGVSVKNISPIYHKFDTHPKNDLANITLGIDFLSKCPDAPLHTINVTPVIADFQRLDGIDSSICIQNSPYKLANLSTNADSVLWDFGDGKTSISKNITSHNFEKPGKYDIRLSVKSNKFICKDTITKTAFVFATPDLNIVGDTVCLGTDLHLSIVNPSLTSQYGWFPKEGLDSQTSTSPVATLQNSTQYTVTEIDVNGCIDTMSVWAYVIRPIELFNWDTSIVIGDKAVLPVKKSSLNYFYWTPTDGLSCTDCDYPVTQPLSDKSYHLKVTDALNCFNLDFEYKIVVRPETFIKMPSAFSPNGDGANDLLEVKGWGIKELLYFQIYNRWGEIVFETTDLEKGWDGTFKGKPQNSDVYTYKVKVKTWRENEDYTEGYVNLFY